jgi:hypothetical protein
MEGIRMDSTTNSLKVHDDNHARAILKGEMRKAREQFIAVYSNVTHTYRKKRKLKHVKIIFKMICEINDKGLKNCLINKIVKDKSAKRAATDYISLGWINIDDNGVTTLKGERLYPVSCEMVKIQFLSMLKVDDPNINNITPLFYLTEHALVRLMRRYHRFDLRSLTDIVSEELQPMKFSNYINAQSDDFIIVTSNAYIPCTHGTDEIPILKTWIPRLVWDSRNLSKLSSLCDFLKERNEIRIFSESFFNDSVYLSPE